MYYVYVLRAQVEENRFYVGSTSDLRKRLDIHNAGKNKSTKNHQWKLVYYEAYLTDVAARQREHKLKQHGKAKQALMRRIRASLDERSKLGLPSP